MRRPDATDWMWAHACDLIAEAEHMQRRFFRLAATPRAQASWEPPVDLFEDGDEVVAVVALPGVVAERVELSSEVGALVVRAERPLPFAGARHRVRRLEIPYGHFECRIALPEGSWEVCSHELTHGCLILRLRNRD
jgi:HSP20 family molecular chaperone IbpA